jgi:hypothetical protein
MTRPVSCGREPASLESRTKDEQEQEHEYEDENNL